MLICERNYFLPLGTILALCIYADKRALPSRVGLCHINFQVTECLQAVRSILFLKLTQHSLLK